MPDLKPIYVLNEAACAARAGQLGRAIVFRQELVNWLQEARDKGCAVVLNAGAYTQTSVAPHYSTKAIGTPVIETHLSNPAAREEFRHVSLVGQAAKGVIAGFGAASYLPAVEAAALLANDQESPRA
ncbi:MAG TPA: type II 3-dehydroquinate dehydratase [Terricaulis sp.]|nr:type II 3-dehydroquinate dehydratase [Terricaulis sp.]HRP10074.1 type II 3-dehydroquinate dehydratase [Terricaulis sp.]